MQILAKLLFQSQLRVADLPLHNRGPLLRSHTLDSSLPPVAAELTLLRHIFQARCFESEPSVLSHCHTMQSDFQCNQREFLTQIYDLALTSNATQVQLESYCEALGMRDHELKSCHKSSPFVEYLTNCRDGNTWTAQPATQIHHLQRSISGALSPFSMASVPPGWVLPPAARPLSTRIQPMTMHGECRAGGKASVRMLSWYNVPRNGSHTGGSKTSQ